RGHPGRGAPFCRFPSDSAHLKAGEPEPGVPALRVLELHPVRQRQQTVHVPVLDSQRHEESTVLTHVRLQAEAVLTVIRVRPALEVHPVEVGQRQRLADHVRVQPESRPCIHVFHPLRFSFFLPLFYSYPLLRAIAEGSACNSSTWCDRSSTHLR